MKNLNNSLKLLVGVAVELREPKKGCWVAAPGDKSLIKSRLWKELRAGPSGGIGQTPVDAALLLARAAGATGPRRVSPRHRARSWLLQLLADGMPQPTTAIRRQAESDSVPWSAVDRAGREVDILREKCGFHGPWTWRLAQRLEVR